MTLALSYLKLLLFSPTVKAGVGFYDIIIIIFYCIVPLRLGDVASRNDAARLTDVPLIRGFSRFPDFIQSGRRFLPFNLAHLLFLFPLR